ncbi:ATP-binding protein [Cognataquiflexum rubidum]|uniref:ATP-binding protein n=1 Tax=Cognataquiflexum rubidum TaxID=2922273 RepID=UPI001F142FD0|nr:ATP-binding protein [Cognataquiflexum rubidum]MCH6232865.1 ATP-binding protein [Cognataquiflexum rubidum]
MDEYEQVIEAIKGGEVDAFALKTNNQSEIFTLRTVDYAYRLLVENFGEGALNLTEEGLIVYTNNYFPRLLNLSYEDVIGNSIYQYVHPESRETFSKLFQKALTSQIKGEIYLSLANNKVPVYISLTSLFPTIPTVGMIITDLTEKKKEEEILKSKNAELIKLNNQLQAFAYITSHDLQGPLRKIQILISHIIDNERIKLSEKGKDFLNRVQYAANSMQVLVQDLLEYSRTNTVVGKLEYTELNQIIDEVKDELKEELEDKKAIVEVTALNSVNIIPFQFRQLMHNLIVNALKFSNPTIRPYILIKSEIAKGIAFDHVKLTPQKEYCHISVSDNGIGFEQEYSEKIFEIFYRLHQQTDYNGTGIGLAIVKNIVENHSGIIIATSKLNKGTTFDIYIPTTLED